MSYALNDRANALSPATRDRILETARQMGYRPNRKARQLRRGANLMLGMHINSMLLSSNAQRLIATLPLTVFQGVAAHAAERGYRVQLVLPAENEDIAEIRRQVVDENAVDGLVLMGLPPEPSVTDGEVDDLVQALGRVKVPATTLDRRVSERGIPLVAVDREAAVRQVAQRLAALGHRQVTYAGMVGHTANEPRSRVMMFQELFEAHGIVLPSASVYDVALEVGAFQLVHRLMSGADRPTCLVFSGDHLAMAAVTALRDLGLDVPRDVSIVSMNNALYARESPVPLATIDHHYHEQGVMLARLLLDRMDDPQASPAPVSLVTATFIDRASLGPAPQTFH